MIIIVIAYVITAAILVFLYLRTNRGGQGGGMKIVPRESSPYREPAPPPKDHGPDCKGCDWIDHYGRWQPPEVVIAVGLPVECLMLKYKKTLDEIDEWAKEYGLVRSQGSQ